MAELILHMNNYSIIGAITAYQTYLKSMDLDNYSLVQQRDLRPNGLQFKWHTL